MLRLGRLIQRPDWRRMMDSIMPGGRNWHADDMRCRRSCPGTGCRWNGPDGLICSTRWRSAEATPENLDILFHVLNDFDYYNDKDLPGLTRRSRVVADLRQFVHEITLDGSFVEGNIKVRFHRYRERNSTAAREIKEAAMRNKSLVCDVCTQDFYRLYGDRARGIIECHHTVPLSSARHRGRTLKKDLSLVCANCHALIHSGKRILSLQVAKRLHREARKN